MTKKNHFKKDIFKGKGVPHHTDPIEFEAHSYRVRTEFMLNDIRNKIRESVTESRAPHIDIEGKESIREDLIRHDILSTMHPITKEKIERDNPLINWEIKNQKFNSKFWVPTKNIELKTPMEVIDDLYHFWEKFLDSYKTETVSMIKEGDKPADTETVSMIKEGDTPADKVFEFLKKEGDKPADKVFEFLINSWREDLDDVDLKRIQLKLEDMTINFKESTVMEASPQLRALFFNNEIGVTAKDFLLDSLVDKIELEKVRKLPAWGIEPIVIWVLSKHFNVFALEQRSVLLATLIADLDKSVREYITEIEEKLANKDVKDVRTKKKKKKG